MQKKMFIKKEGVVLDYKESTKEILKKLDEDPTAYNLFNLLVVQKNIISSQEFFQCKQDIQQCLEKKITRKDAEGVLNFINFDKSIKDGKELIMFTKDDKHMFFNHFPEIKKKFEEQYFGKFNDRKLEEAKFWNDFFRQQFEENTLLKGNTLEQKRATNKPNFVEEVIKKLKKNKEFDLNENFQDITNTEHEQKYLNIENSTQTNLISSINNLSVINLYKNLQGDDQVTEEDLDKKLKDIEEFCVKVQLKKEIDNNTQEPVSPLKRRSSFSQRQLQESYSQNDLNFQNMYSKYISKLQQRAFTKIENSNLNRFFQQNNSSDIDILSIMEDQIQKQINSEKINSPEYESNYDQVFLREYKILNANTLLYLKIYYKLFPINIQRDLQKLHDVSEQMKQLKDKIGKLRNQCLEKYNRNDMAVYVKPLEILAKLIEKAFEKLKTIKKNNNQINK